MVRLEVALVISVCHIQFWYTYWALVRIRILDLLKDEEEGTYKLHRIRYKLSVLGVFDTWCYLIGLCR